MLGFGPGFPECPENRADATGPIRITFLFCLQLWKSGLESLAQLGSNVGPAKLWGALAQPNCSWASENQDLRACQLWILAQELGGKKSCHSSGFLRSAIPQLQLLPRAGISCPSASGIEIGGAEQILPPSLNSWLDPWELYGGHRDQHERPDSPKLGVPSALPSPFKHGPQC